MSTTRATESDWATIHDERESWRKKLVGDISDAFIIPRYVRFFYESFGQGKQHDFCEIGSGNGDIARAILRKNDGLIQRYVTSEVFPEGVEWLRKQGLEAVQANAEELPWDDAEFDAAVTFDVMHHVSNPRRMAREMMRIARGSCLLVESNGVSIFRKLRELTPGHRAAGEKSYGPATYRSFFDGHPEFELLSFSIEPFLFPFKCPAWLLNAAVRFNQLIEQVPLVRWQCSSVMIRVNYRRVGAAQAQSEAPAQGEIGAWALAHYEEPFYSQRTAKLPGKLARLGAFGLPREAQILDAGCGKGEALAFMRQFGYTNLSGVDLTEHPEWSRLPEVHFEASDMTRMPFPDGQFDAIINLHALHHMGNPRGVADFLAECTRVLKPGGKLMILDYEGSAQINLLHWCLRKRVGTITPGLRNFAQIQDQEWSFLGPYLHEWPLTREILENGPLRVDRWKRDFWLYYLTLVKPAARDAQRS
jgi:SAM-dependent methyltransferase